METFWYRLTQVHLEKWPLNWRDFELMSVSSAMGILAVGLAAMVLNGKHAYFFVYDLVHITEEGKIFHQQSPRFFGNFCPCLIWSNLQQQAS